MISPLANDCRWHYEILSFFQLCTSEWGWPSVYYVHAIVCVFLFLLWAFYYRDDPKMHQSVSSIELEKIQRHKSDEHNDHGKHARIPYAVSNHCLHRDRHNIRATSMIEILVLIDPRSLSVLLLIFSKLVHMFIRTHSHSAIAGIYQGILKSYV